MGTRTHAHFWVEELAELDRAITTLERSWEERAPFVDQELRDRAESRLRILRAAWYLSAEPAD